MCYSEETKNGIGEVSSKIGSYKSCQECQWSRIICMDFLIIQLWVLALRNSDISTDSRESCGNRGVENLIQVVKWSFELVMENVVGILWVFQHVEVLTIAGLSVIDVNNCLIGVDTNFSKGYMGESSG